MRGLGREGGVGGERRRVRGTVGCENESENSSKKERGEESEREDEETMESSRGDEK